jgi:sulfatase modifying factor 1
MRRVGFGARAVGGLVGAWASLACGRERPSVEPPVDASTAAPMQATAMVASDGAWANPDAAASPDAGLGDAPAPPCPPEMILVEGDYCPDVLHTCLKWLDPPGPYEKFRCARYGKPQCRSAQRAHLRFCIDRDEYTPPGEALPAVHHSWTTAKGTCASLGKRLCLESEWQFACEGPEMRPYPYGLERDATACNIDRMDLGKPNSGLRDDREPAGSHPRCLSPFGVRDMSGNVEEWATLDHPTNPSDRSTMKGAWWLPGRNHCRAATTDHGETYEGAQVGVRCCKPAG